MGNAVIVFLCAFFLTPEQVGQYSWMVIVLGLCQATFDAAVRQVAVSAVATRSGRAFLRRYQVAYSLIGSAFSAIVIGVLCYTTSSGRPLLLAPAVVAPVFTARGAKYVADLQLRHQWRRLATIQTVSVFGSLLICLPLLVILRNNFAPALQLTLVEFLAFAQARRFSLRQAGTAPAIDVGVHQFHNRDFYAASAYALLGWGQGQADRIVVGFRAGSSALGQYNLSVALGRNASDAIGSAAANVLRPQLMSESDPMKRRALAESLISRAVAVTAAQVVAVFVVARWILPNVLSEAWHSALHAAPLFAAVALPSVVAWSTTVVMIRNSTMQRGLPVRIVGLLLAVPVGLAAVRSLELAAVVMMIREVVLMWILIAVAGGDAPRRSAVFCTVGSLLLFIVLWRWS